MIVGQLIFSGIVSGTIYSIKSESKKEMVWNQKDQQMSF